jgi:hypothetical protein
MEAKVMEAVRYYTVVEKDGEISMTDLPCKKGQYVEMILLMEISEPSHCLTARQLLNSDFSAITRMSPGASDIRNRQKRTKHP